MSVATISTKGQITLPAKIRAMLGMKPHDRVVIEAAANGILVKPALDIFALKGFLGKSLGSEEEKKRIGKAIAAHHRGGKA